MAQQLLDIQFGFATQSTIKFRGASLSASNIVVTLSNGMTATLSSMTEIGTDSGDGAKPRAGYLDSGSITGLESFTDYNWTATQDGNSISGTCRTAPSDADDFCLYVGTCEENNGSFGAGMHPHFKAYLQSQNALRCAGLIHIDDHGYWDQSDVASGAAYTFTTAHPNKTRVYDFALGAFAGTGLYDGDTYADYGQDEDRLWFRRNVALLPQWGDHDTGTNEMGWSTIPTDTKFVNSKVIWDAFMGPLQGEPIVGAITNGDNGWMSPMGCVEIIAPDGIQKCSGDGTWPVMTAPTTIYGATQIDNVLSAIQTSTKPFKFMLMNYGIKYMDFVDVLNTPNATVAELANNPLKDWRLNEFQQFFTATGNTPPSLMDNPFTNGQFGDVTTLHGDVHMASVIQHSASAYTGNAKENFKSISVAGLNKPTSAPKANIIEGWEYDGSKVDYVDVGAQADFYALRIEVYGSKQNKEVHFVFLSVINGVETIGWTEKLVQRRGGNETHAIDKNLDLNAGISDKAM